MVPVPRQRSGCTVETAMEVIGGRWKAVVLYRLLAAPRRHHELRRLLPACSQRVLTLQLRELERDGLVQRTVHPTSPPQVVYALTGLGRSLEPILLALRGWGADYRRAHGAE